MGRKGELHLTPNRGGLGRPNTLENDMRKYSARSLRSLKGIHPDLRRVIDRALQESPLDFVVIEGLRTKERQRKLVASGASKTMNSRHITGHAVDLLPIGPNGPAFDWPLYHKLGPAVKEAAEAEGVAIVWGADWRSFKDGPHFQLSHKVYPASEWSTGQTFKPRKLAQSRTMQGAATAGAGTGLGIVSDTLQQVQSEIGGLAYYLPTLQYIAVAITVIGLGITIYARYDDWKGGHQ